MGWTSARVVRTSPSVFDDVRASLRNAAHPHPRSGARFATRPSHGSRLSFTRCYSSSGVLVYEWLLFRVCAQKREEDVPRVPRGAPRANGVQVRDERVRLSFVPPHVAVHVVFRHRRFEISNGFGGKLRIFGAVHREHGDATRASARISSSDGGFP